MSEAKHTPGPWEWDSVCPEWLVRSETKDTVLDFTDRLGIQGSSADKSLIAAAPDLLESLEEIKREASKGGDLINTDSIFILAASAIAKATGKEKP